MAMQAQTQEVSCNPLGSISCLLADTQSDLAPVFFKTTERSSDETAIDTPAWAHYILVDMENVVPRSFDLPFQDSVKIVLFMGAMQAGLVNHILPKINQAGHDFEVVHIDFTGKNSLDFHLALYIGRLVSLVKPPYRLHVVSKDHGYDALLKTISKRWVDACRHESLEAVYASINTVGTGRKRSVLNKPKPDRAVDQPDHLNLLAQITRLLGHQDSPQIHERLQKLSDSKIENKRRHLLGMLRSIPEHSKPKTLHGLYRYLAERTWSKNNKRRRHMLTMVDLFVLVKFGYVVPGKNRIAYKIEEKPPRKSGR